MSASANSSFWSDGSVLIKTSLYTRHYGDDPRHNNHQRMFNVEWIADSAYAPDSIRRDFARSPSVRWLTGLASFRNSFGQQSTYVYGGLRHDWMQGEQTTAYIKITGGLLHGYRGDYRDKIPLNHLGVAPAILPAVGLDYRRLNLELILFGTAGLMATIGINFN